MHPCVHKEATGPQGTLSAVPDSLLTHILRRSWTWTWPGIVHTAGWPASPHGPCETP
jgi:hypothetical protein